MSSRWPQQPVPWATSSPPGVKCHAVSLHISAGWPAVWNVLSWGQVPLSGPVPMAPLPLNTHEGLFLPLPCTMEPLVRTRAWLPEA